MDKVEPFAQFRAENRERWDAFVKEVANTYRRERVTVYCKPGNKDVKVYFRDRVEKNASSSVKAFMLEATEYVNKFYGKPIGLVVTIDHERE